MVVVIYSSGIVAVMIRNILWYNEPNAVNDNHEPLVITYCGAKQPKGSSSELILPSAG